MRSGLLPLLHLLLLLRVLLLQLLRLLLVDLFQLLLFRFIGRLLREALMILVLLSLEILTLLRLLGLELLLLLLESHIVLGVARVRSGKMFGWRNILGMDCRRWASVLDSRMSGFGGRSSSFGFRTSCLGSCSRIIVVLVGSMNYAAFFGGYSAASFEGAGLLCSSDGRFAVVGGSA